MTFNIYACGHVLVDPIKGLQTFKKVFWYDMWECRSCRYEDPGR